MRPNAASFSCSAPAANPSGAHFSAPLVSALDRAGSFCRTLAGRRRLKACLRASKLLAHRIQSISLNASDKKPCLATGAWVQAKQGDRCGRRVLSRASSPQDMPKAMFKIDLAICRTLHHSEIHLGAGGRFEARKSAHIGG